MGMHMSEEEHVKPQNLDLQNSEKLPGSARDLELAAGGDGFCYWNDKKYSDGAMVCDTHQRYKCWSGKWVDIGNC
jgi:hypothetical protein